MSSLALLLSIYPLASWQKKKTFLLDNSLIFCMYPLSKHLLSTSYIHLVPFLIPLGTPHILGINTGWTKKDSRETMAGQTELCPVPQLLFILFPSESPLPGLQMVALPSRGRGRGGWREAEQAL